MLCATKMSTTFEEARYAPVPGVWEIIRTLSGLVLVLGVAAALVAGVLLRNESVGTAATAAAPPAAQVLLTSHPDYYIVGSVEDARRWEQTLQEARTGLANLGIAPPVASFRIVVLDEP